MANKSREDRKRDIDDIGSVTLYDLVSDIILDGLTELKPSSEREAILYIVSKDNMEQGDWINIVRTALDGAWKSGLSADEIVGLLLSISNRRYISSIWRDGRGDT